LKEIHSVSMAPTSKSLTAVEKSKDAVSVIKKRLIPVLQRLTDDTFGEATGRARASVALSIGMLRYMAARLRGLDQGRKPNDPLRKDLNNMKRVLANITKKLKKTATTTNTEHEYDSKKSEGKTKEKNRKVEVDNKISSKNLDPIRGETFNSKIQCSDTCDTKNIAPIRMKRENNDNNNNNNNINNYRKTTKNKSNNTTADGESPEPKSKKVKKK